MTLLKWVGCLAIWMMSFSWSTAEEGVKKTEPPLLLGRVSQDHQGQTPYPLIFSDVKGQSHVIESYKGRFVLVKVWKTTCPPCLMELQSLKSLVSALKGEKIAILPICLDATDHEVIQGKLNDYQANGLEVYINALDIRNLFGISGVPFSVLLDPKGEEIWRKQGGPTAWDHPVIVAYFKDLLSTL